MSRASNDKRDPVVEVVKQMEWDRRQHECQSTLPRQEDIEVAVHSTNHREDDEDREDKMMRWQIVGGGSHRSKHISDTYPSHRGANAALPRRRVAVSNKQEARTQKKRHHEPEHSVRVCKHRNHREHSIENQKHP